MGSRKLGVALTLVLLLMACGRAQAPVPLTEEFRQDIRSLLTMMGSDQLGRQMAGQMIASMSEAMPAVPEAVWKRFADKIDFERLNELVIPIYAKYFTDEEIKALIAFYSTPLGQKVIATLPAVMQESMEVGQSWGKEAAEQVLKELEAEGYFPSTPSEE